MAGALAVLAACAPVYEPGVTVQPPLRAFTAAGLTTELPTTSVATPREYRINPGDVISIKFPRRPALSDSLLVRPDGRISPPLLGSVMAASHTVDELQATLTSGYARLVRSAPPPAQRRYPLQPDDVLDIRFAYFPDMNTQATVRGDGRISLPMIGDVLVEGRTPRELQQRLVGLYTDKIANPELSVALREARSNVFEYRGQLRTVPDPALTELALNVTKTVPLLVYVGGEVPAPGLQPFITDSNALQAIYSAGGPAPSGDMRSVVILRRGPDDGVIRLVANLTDDLAGRGTGNTLIQPFDVIVVPRSNIVQFGDVLEQYLYRTIRPLANSSMGFFFTRQIGTINQETTVRNLVQ